MQISLGLPPPSEQSSLPMLKRVLDGIRRCKVLGGKSPRKRLPITTTVLRRIEAPLKEDNALEASAFWAIAVTAFFGFFRLGELLVETEADYTPALHLSWGDVAVDVQSKASMVKIHLKKSKCDQFGKGADILLGRTGCPLCPVAAILSFIGARRDTPGCFFWDQQKKPITKSRFVARLRDALSKAGYAEAEFAGHSFRIGAATSAALAGIEDSMIQALGRPSNVYPGPDPCQPQVNPSQYVKEQRKGSRGKDQTPGGHENIMSAQLNQKNDPNQ
ncbi:hypothetical protein EMCRGX_G019082 [Ephydatia muelleri]